MINIMPNSASRTWPLVDNSENDRRWMTSKHQERLASEMIQLGLSVLKPGSDLSLFPTVSFCFSPQPANPAGWEVNTFDGKAGCPVICGYHAVCEVFAARKSCPSPYFWKQRALL